MKCAPYPTLTPSHCVVMSRNRIPKYRELLATGPSVEGAILYRLQQVYPRQLRVTQLIKQTGFQSSAVRTALKKLAGVRALQYSCHLVRLRASALQFHTKASAADRKFHKEQARKPAQDDSEPDTSSSSESSDESSSESDYSSESSSDCGSSSESSSDSSDSDTLSSSSDSDTSSESSFNFSSDSDDTLNSFSESESD